METMLKIGSGARLSGFLADFLSKQGIAQGTDPVGLVSIAFGAELMNCGVLLEGLRAWSKVGKWGSSEIGLAKKVTDPARLVNAIAEQYFGAFEKGEEYGLPAFAAGAILGEEAAEISSFYEEASEFLTRAVGLRYEGRKECLEDLAVGVEVLLVWDQQNPYDPKALRLITQKGQDLGFVRKPIAHRLVARIKSGTALRGKIALLLSEQYDINERVWIKVEAVKSASGPAQGEPEPAM